MIENFCGLEIQNNVRADFSRSSIRRLKKDGISRRPKKPAWRFQRLVSRLFLLQIVLRHNEVRGISHRIC